MGLRGKMSEKSVGEKKIVSERNFGSYEKCKRRKLYVGEKESVCE
jgi:hypothetical protein